MTTKRTERDWRAKVRAELATRGWKAIDLGRKMGMEHPEHAARWIRAKAPTEPLWPVVVAMADVLSVSLDWIAGRIPGPDVEWTDEDRANALKSLSPSSAKVVRVLGQPGGAAHLEQAADQYLALRKSLGR